MLGVKIALWSLTLLGTPMEVSDLPLKKTMTEDFDEAPTLLKSSLSPMEVALLARGAYYNTI